MPETKQKEVCFEQTLGEEDFAAACRLLDHCASPWRRRGVRAGVCVTAAAAVAAFLPAYLRRFASAVAPGAVIGALLLCACAFFFLQPWEETRRARRRFLECPLAALPARLCVTRDRVQWNTRCERCTEYWTEFRFCAESPSLFAASGGSCRGMLAVKKSGLTPEQAESLRACLSGAFAGRYNTLKKDV